MLALLARCARQATSGRTGVLDQACRCMATAAKPAEPKLPAPPIQLSGTSASIATLTWQVAAKEKVVEKVQEELRQLSEAFASTSKDLEAWHRLATDPFVPTLVRKKIVSNVLAGSTSEITARLLDSLAEENALSAVPSISTAFDQLVLAFKKEVYVTIVTAEPMDKLERGEVVKQASKFVDPGFKLVAQEKVDPSLIGGFVLEFEDRLVDLSTKKKVDEFNTLVTKLENDLK